MSNYEIIVRNEIENKRRTGEEWENEYGSFETNTIKYKYENAASYNVHFYEKNNLMYFKIVPSYFKLSCGYIYWEYYDGCVENGNVKIVPINKLTMVRIRV